MLKYCAEKWDKNKTLLMNALQSEEIYNELRVCIYADLVQLVVKYILNNEKEEYDTGEWDENNITEVDNGDYQGTLLYLIPAKTSQPCANEYLITFVDYGSCGGCDTLIGIQTSMPYQGYCESDEQFVILKRKTIEDFMTLCLRLVQHIKKPYIDILDGNDFSDE